MSGEDRSEHRGLVWRKRIVAPIASVVEQYRREWPAAMRAPEQGVQRDRPAPHQDRVRSAGDLGLDARWE